LMNEPLSPTIDETITFLNAALAANPTEDWTSCTQHVHAHQFTLWVDDAHRTIYIQSDFPRASCSKTAEEPEQWLAANLDADVPVEGELECRLTRCTFPVISRQNTYSFLNLYCLPHKPCARYSSSGQFLGGTDNPLIIMTLTMSGDVITQEHVARALLHLVKLMQQENATP
jgi:hypothetical protein